MATLHLTHVDPAHRATAIRAVRAALVSGGFEGTRQEALDEAEKAIYAVLTDNEPYPLIEGSAVQCTAAQRAFEEMVPDGIAARVARDLTIPHAPETPSNPSDAPIEGAGGVPETRVAVISAIDQMFLADPPDDFAPGPEAAYTALAFLSMTEGNALQAWLRAKHFASIAGDPEFFTEVGHTLYNAFLFQKIERNVG
jgi:hypothetical protein